MPFCVLAVAVAVRVVVILGCCFGSNARAHRIHYLLYPIVVKACIKYVIFIYKMAFNTLGKKMPARTNTDNSHFRVYFFTCF